LERELCSQPVECIQPQFLYAKGRFDVGRGVEVRNGCQASEGRVPYKKDDAPPTDYLASRILLGRSYKPRTYQPPSRTLHTRPTCMTSQAQRQGNSLPVPVASMELWASGFNAWGNLDFDDTTVQVWPDLHSFSPVLKDERVWPRALYRSATLGKAMAPECSLSCPSLNSFKLYHVRVA
jgi:hypothetical protein